MLLCEVLATKHEHRTILNFYQTQINMINTDFNYSQITNHKSQIISRQVEDPMKA